MASESDSFDDPRMAELLRRFGHDVSKTDEPLFEAPEDLLQRLARGAPLLPAHGDPPVGKTMEKPPRKLWIAAAAALLIAIGIWTWRPGGRASPPAPQLAALVLSDQPTRVRHASRDAFRDGESVYLHFRSDREGEASLLWIDARLTLSAPLGRIHVIEAGDNTIGPVVLEGGPGIEVFVVLTGGRGGDGDLAATTDALVARLATSDEADLDARLRSILSAIAELEGVSGIDFVFEYSPR